MNEQVSGRVAPALWEALGNNDWEAAAALLADDFVQEWPQSGERIVGVENAIEINRNFPRGLPEMTIRRSDGNGSLEVLEVELNYADGCRYLGVSILALRDGKVTKETDYFAQPFPAPQWRAQWVEKM
jgi:ketosteroid isomerase-like protein